MKRTLCFLVWALLAISSFSLVSCNDDDENEKHEKNSLVGVWVSEESIPQYDEDEQKVTANAIVYFQFSEDGSFLEKDVITKIRDGYTYTETSTYGRWMAHGNTLKISYSFEDIEDPRLYLDEIEFTYNIVNNKLILTVQTINNEVRDEHKTFTFVRGQMP